MDTSSTGMAKGTRTPSCLSSKFQLSWFWKHRNFNFNEALEFVNGTPLWNKEKLEFKCHIQGPIAEHQAHMSYLEEPQ